MTSTSHVHPDAVVTVHPGAQLELGDGCRIGPKARIVCHERIVIGAGAVLEQEVVLVDADPRFDDVEQPIRKQGLTTAPVTIGAGAVVHRGAVVHPGVTVGERAVVGHHAVVTKDVPPGVTVEGVPARPVGTPAGGTSATSR